MRQGFTLVETLVALVLFQFGMLAVAAAMGVAARDLTVAQRIARAHSMARNRVELIRAAGCPSPASATLDHTGGGGTEGLVEHWRVEADGTQRFITDSVEFALPAGRRGRVVLRAAAICPP